MLQVGDAVRALAGTGSAELLAELADLTGEVRAVSGDRGQRVNLVYEGVAGGMGCYVFGVPAADFRRDRPLGAAPF